MALLVFVVTACGESAPEAPIEPIDAEIATPEPPAPASPPTPERPTDEPSAPAFEEPRIDEPPACPSLPPACTVTEPPPPVVVHEGFWWWLPPSATIAPDSGFSGFDADPAYRVDTRTIDLTWRQIEPAPGLFVDHEWDETYGMTLESLAVQVAKGGPFWLRVFTTREDWAPDWVQAECDVAPMGDSGHLPIFDACVWSHMRRMWSWLLLRYGILEHPDFRYAYVPGGFEWGEFDFNVLEAAVEDGLTAARFHEWFHGAMADLAAMAGPDAGRLVYTGEDFGWGPWEIDGDLLARDAVRLGLGVRNGIPEAFDLHLNHTPAYGNHLTADGYVVHDEDWPPGPPRVIATEVECIDSCDKPPASEDVVARVVRMALLKSLQLRANRIFVVPDESHMPDHPKLWTWARYGLGHGPDTASDAFVALRDGYDAFFDRWVKNLGRWLEQVDVCPDGHSVAGAQIDTPPRFEGDQAKEGRRTRVAEDQSALYLDVHEAFVPGEHLVLAVTWRDESPASFRVEFEVDGCLATTAAVSGMGDSEMRTAAFRLDGLRAGNAIRGADLRIRVLNDWDIEVHLVRLIRTYQGL